MAYKLAVLEIFEKFVCISIYCMSTLSLHITIESTDSMIYLPGLQTT